MSLDYSQPPRVQDDFKTSTYVSSVLYAPGESAGFCSSWCICSVLPVVVYLQCSVRRGVSAV